MTDYSKMSDFEINKHVAIEEGHPCYYGNGSYTNGMSGRRAIVKSSRMIGGFDPCNEPHDAWPIITANKINVLWNMSNWSAWSSELSELENNHENPLRAAMIVFLMMKDAENANPS